MIIIYDGNNDIRKPLDVYFDRKNASLYSKLTEFFQSHNHIYKTPLVLINIIGDFRTNLINDSTIYPFDETGILEKSNAWKSNMDEFCKFSNNNDIESLVILQPMLGSSDRELSDHEQLLFKRYDNQKILENYENFSLMLNELESSCNNIIDMRNIFNEISEPVYYDSVHLSDMGNKIVAEKIYNIINYQFLD